jgi:hypothetical protein
VAALVCALALVDPHVAALQATVPDRVTRSGKSIAWLLQ